METPKAKVLPIYDQTAQCETLIIHCIDYRIQQGVDQLAAQYLRINGNFDRLAVPGGIL